MGTSFKAESIPFTHGGAKLCAAFLAIGAANFTSPFGIAAEAAVAPIPLRNFLLEMLPTLSFKSFLISPPPT